MIFFDQIRTYDLMLNMILRLAKDHELLKFWPCGRLKGPKIKDPEITFHPKQLGFRSKISCGRKWKGLWSYHVMCRMFHTFLAWIHGILEDKRTFIYINYLLPIFACSKAIAKIFNPPVYHYQEKEGSYQMALCSSHLIPTFISVLAVIYAALQQSRFHTFATKHLFMLPTGFWLRGQPPDSAIFLASSTYCHTGPPYLFAQFYNNLESRHA